MMDRLALAGARLAPRRWLSACHGLRNVELWDRGARDDTPLMASVKKIEEDYTNCVRLIQVGSFYELYGDQAEQYGPRLGLKVAQRNSSTILGFPYHQLEKYVKLLVHDLQETTAIVDQIGDEKQAIKNILHRKVVRVVTPGTLIDESFLNFNQNNYLLAVSFPKLMMAEKSQDVDLNPEMKIGLAWADISLGELHIQETTLKLFLSDVARIQPSEIVILHSFKEYVDFNDPNLSDLKRYFVRYHKYEAGSDLFSLASMFKIEQLTYRQKIDLLIQTEFTALKIALSYISINLPDRNPSFEFPKRYLPKTVLQMDGRTREALELSSRTLVEGKLSHTATLFSTIRRTLTDSGSRMLYQWISSPSTDVKELLNRQNFVQFYLDNPLIQAEVRNVLSNVGDFTRSAQRLALKLGDPVTHMKYIAAGLKQAYELEAILSSKAFSKQPNLIKHINFTDIRHVIELVESTFEDLDGFLVKKDYNQELITEHAKLQTLLHQKESFFLKISKRATTHSKKFKITMKLHKKFGETIHISSSVATDLEEFLKNSPLSEVDISQKTARTVYLRPKDWNYVHIRIEEQRKKIESIENKILQECRLQVLKELEIIRETGRLLDFIDVTSSFAVLAKDLNLARPEFSFEENVLHIKNGKHLVVEKSINDYGGLPFVANDTHLDGSNSSLWVITGPNMGGKSTFLRQNALIIILSQIGSYVPADSCKLKIVDRIFTRIGAQDDISKDLSTFMVEMVETSNILENATKNSVAIVDEIGRGTSGKEGLAIAYAALDHLLTVNKCRTLFATHYGLELKELLDQSTTDPSRIGYYKTTATSRNSQITYEHKLIPGISERSYAMEVAQKAGFPHKALQTASNAYDLIIAQS